MPNPDRLFSIKFPTYKQGDTYEDYKERCLKNQEKEADLWYTKVNGKYLLPLLSEVPKGFTRFINDMNLYKTSGDIQRGIKSMVQNECKEKGYNLFRGLLERHPYLVDDHIHKKFCKSYDNYQEKIKKYKKRAYFIKYSSPYLCLKRPLEVFMTIEGNRICKKVTTNYTYNEKQQYIILEIPHDINISVHTALTNRWFGGDYRGVKRYTLRRNVKNKGMVYFSTLNHSTTTPLFLRLSYVKPTGGIIRTCRPAHFTASVYPFKEMKGSKRLEVIDSCYDKVEIIADFAQRQKGLETWIWSVVNRPACPSKRFFWDSDICERRLVGMIEEFL